MTRAEIRHIAVADIGGTHARFAIAEIADGAVVSLGAPIILRTADHASLAEAWHVAFAGDAPREAAIALAAPVGGDALHLTNNRWVIYRADLPRELGIDRPTLLNDFGAVAHAVAALPEEWFAPLCGPAGRLPEEGVISVIGPGTGLGVAQLVRIGGATRVIETESGHVDFAPVDRIDDAILALLRARHGRVSAERVASGPGLAAIYEAVTGHAPTDDDPTLWARALAGGDRQATDALDHFCRCLGSIAGDIALAQGASAVVIAGGLGMRLAEYLPRTGFAQRFIAKGRFGDHLARLPIRLLLHPEPGLFGAAAAHAAISGSGIDQ